LAAVYESRPAQPTSASTVLETMIEPGCELFYAKRSGARRSEFYRKGDAVKATTNSGDRAANPRVRRKVW